MCENETLRIDCDEGQRITIHSANYGRLHRNICSDNDLNKNTQTCSSFSVSLDTVQETCDGLQSCEVPATSSYFGGDPCGGIHKYLEVTYTCEGKKTCEIVQIETKIGNKNKSFFRTSGDPVLLIYR